MTATPSRPVRIAALAGWLVLCYATAAVGAVASIQAATFYLQLDRPAWSPPAWVFGPVWSVLYTLMAIAAWLAWLPRAGAAGGAPDEGRARLRTIAFSLFVLQLALNALWSWLFFAWHLGAWASVEVLLLLASIVGTVLAFRRLRPLAAALMLPYLAWVAFASALTFSVWLRNPGMLG